MLIDFIQAELIYQLINFNLINHFFSSDLSSSSSSLLSIWCSNCAQIEITMPLNAVISQVSIREWTTREKVAEHRTKK